MNVMDMKNRVRDFACSQVTESFSHTKILPESS